MTQVKGEIISVSIGGKEYNFDHDPTTLPESGVVTGKLTVEDDNDEGFLKWMNDFWYLELFTWMVETMYCEG